MSDKQITLTNLSSFKQKYDAKMAAEMAQKQDVSPDGLKTSANTVVGAINELYDDIHEGGEGVTSLGGKQGDITLGDGLVINEDKVLSATGGSGDAGVTSLGGTTGDITLGAGLQMNDTELQLTITPGTKIYQYTVNTGNTSATWTNVGTFFKSMLSQIIRIRTRFNTSNIRNTNAFGVKIAASSATMTSMNITVYLESNGYNMWTPTYWYSTDKICLTSNTMGSASDNSKPAYDLQLNIWLYSVWRAQVSCSGIGTYVSGEGLQLIEPFRVAYGDGTGKVSNMFTDFTVYSYKNIDNLPAYITKTIL